MLTFFRGGVYTGTMFITENGRPFYFYFKNGCIHWPNGKYLFADGDIKPIPAGLRRAYEGNTYFLCYEWITGLNGKVELYDTVNGIPLNMKAVLAVVYLNEGGGLLTVLNDNPDLIDESEIKPKIKWKYPPGC